VVRQFEDIVLGIQVYLAMVEICIMISTRV
jgi:hypothetical protein